MKFNAILAIGCMSLFAVSCAHKPVDTETKITQETPKVTPMYKSVETKAVEQKKDGALSFNCTLGSDSRTITLQKDDKRCEVHYTKSGTLNNIAWGEKTPTLCDRVFDQVRTTIEKGGFKCTGEGQNTASTAN